ncbi:peptidoglycan/LPS O-acetylase OafA/YrhL/lysophospholipase L1-like esterase [Mycobacterium frederiksbergense]|uniref:Peptidoglycan/LPS O-acetylase OafA/YrhL/lysophospholipase L1-like esterase n=1 Tax=Mycolicibacterium frederiksbergense TaxID=117567 RepID=A0ABT6L870_9MYCO|nr:acyltransferase family protein [Mycolicibacterium frederiksbergense]MDH6199110.1 peptidoglycan/LPS O-acetylase OafA/YrhL/lysophospholipase L1-like esterase [Mycolicibacterium frederiksbergense]
MTAAPARAAGWRRRASFRRDIPALDGIRAVAVALVLAGHGGVPGVAGGFIGVDIFFVLSGFLITSLLLDEFGRTDRIDLKGFWIRRAKRLLPAMVLMTLFVVAARDLFPPDAVSSLRDDAVGAFFWVANWLFVAADTDYFSQGSTPSPLQHTWSLAVEEQYYVIWPLLVLAAVLLVRRRSVTAVRATVFGLAVAGMLASAVAAILLAGDPAQLNRVYFGTDTRAQALLVGAAAAALLVRDWSTLTVSGTLIRARWRRWVAWTLPVIGVAVLAVAAHLATGSADQFRHGLLIVVALGAVLVIAPVALDQDGYVARALAWYPLVTLGVISYGVYLWHWPIFLILNGERTGLDGWALLALRCAVTIAVSWVSWWLIEQPVRHWRPQHVPMLRLAAATVATAAVVTMNVVPAGMTARPESPNVMSAAATQPDVGAEVPVAVGAPPTRLAPGTRTVAVFGDSVAWTLMRYLPATPGFRFSDYTTIGCGIARGGPYRSAGETVNQKPECDTWPERWVQRIAHDRPDTVLLMIGRWETVDRTWSGRWTHIGNSAYDEYLKGELRRALDILSSTGARVVVTTAPYNRRGERSDGTLYPEDQPGRVQAWNTMLRSVAAQRAGVSVLDFNAKLNPDGKYTARVNGIRMRSDGVHPTAEAVEWLTPWLLESVKAAPKQPGK